MPARASDAAAVAAIAVIATLIIAATVVRAPSAHVFGMPSAGHHHDPFTVMRQFDRLAASSVQPLTDVPGALLSRAVGPVAAFNGIVLLSFPLSAAAAYLLARHLGIGRRWSALAGLAFAFSPFHLAHAAYHPHVAQTQWLPIYLLALWRCFDHPGARAIALFAIAAAAVTWSNLYGGLIAALITPPALGAYWYFTARHASDARRRAMRTGAVVVAVFIAVAIHAVWQLRGIGAAAAPDDLVRYGARWWSYVVPPVAHPIAGTSVARFWHARGVDIGLVEQQLALGTGVIVLAIGALADSFIRPRAPGAAAVRIAAAVAAAALILSLAPGASGLAPSVAVHWALPMFRAFARFGVVVQLMAVVLAAAGAQRLWNLRVRHARVICVLLLVLVASEYTVSPAAMSRPALPTPAHRQVAGMSGHPRVLDCVPAAADAGAIHWLTSGRVTPFDAAIDDCLEPNLAGRLVAAGFTHLIIRHDSVDGRRLRTRPVPAGWQRAAHFGDSDLFALGALPPAVHTVSMSGFYPREHDERWTWRWMGADGAWWIANNTGGAVTATLDIEIMAAPGARVLEVRLDGVHVQSITATGERAMRRVGPLVLSPGGHELHFNPDAVTQAPDGDSRRLSFRIGTWMWLAAKAPQ